LVVQLAGQVSVWAVVVLAAVIALRIALQCRVHGVA
jgi:hypothetical protein